MFPFPDPKSLFLWDILLPWNTPGVTLSSGEHLQWISSKLKLLQKQQNNAYNPHIPILNAFPSHFQDFSHFLHGLEPRLWACRAHNCYRVSKSQPFCNENVTNDKYLKGCDAYFYIYYPDLYVFGFYFMFYGASLGLFPATHTKTPQGLPECCCIINPHGSYNYCTLMPAVITACTLHWCPGWWSEEVFRRQEICIPREFPGGIFASHPVINCCASCGKAETFPSSWRPRLMEKPPWERSAVHSLLCPQGWVFSLVLAIPQGKNQGEQQAQGGEREHFPTGFSLCCLAQEGAGEHEELIPL